jgi:hypothetical protein
MANNMFPEGVGKPKAGPKAGKATELTNELIVNAKEAVDALWKERGYKKMSPAQRKAKLGYALDREEALGYVVVSALHKPLPSPEEARTVGKRAGSLPIFAKLTQAKKRGTAGSTQFVELLAERAPLSFAPPKQNGKPQPKAQPAEPPPAPPPEPTPTGATRSKSEALAKLFGTVEAATACAAAHRYEMELGDLQQRRQWEDDGIEDPWETWDEDELDLRKLNYRKALRQLGYAFPELLLNVQELVAGVPANENNSQPCPCGHGRVLRWPWMLDTEALGFCACEMALHERICLRGQWIDPTGLGW